MKLWAFAVIALVLATLPPAIPAASQDHKAARRAVEAMRGHAAGLVANADALEATLPPPNRPPEGIEITPEAVPEDTELGAEVARLVAVDEDPKKFSVVSDIVMLCRADDAVLCLTAPLDFAEAKSFLVEVTASGGQAETTATLLVAVSDVPDSVPSVGGDFVDLASFAKLVGPGEAMHWDDPATVFQPGHQFAGEPLPDTSVGALMAWVKQNQAPEQFTGNPFHVNVWGSLAKCPNGDIWLHGGGHSHGGITTYVFPAGGNQWEIGRPNWTTPSKASKGVDLSLAHDPEGPWSAHRTWPDGNSSPQSVHTYGGLLCDTKGILWRFGGAQYSDGGSTVEVWSLDTNDPESWWQPGVWLWRTYYVRGMVELNGKLYIATSHGVSEYDRDLGTPELAQKHMGLWLDYLRLFDRVRRAEFRLAELVKAEAPEEGIDAATALVADLKAQRDAKEAEAANVRGPGKVYNQVLRGKVRALAANPDTGEIIGVGRNICANRIGKPGGDWQQFCWTGDVPLHPDKSSRLASHEPAITWDPKRKIFWLWAGSATMKDYVFAVKFKESNGVLEGELTAVPLTPDAPVKTKTPYENIRRWCGTSQNRLIYHPELDVFSIYCSVNHGWYVFRPPEEIGGPTGVFARLPDPADPTGPWPIDSTGAAPSLFGDYRICRSKADDPSCTYESYKSTPEPGGKTTVFESGNHGQVEIDDPDVTFLCEPGAWFGIPWLGDGRGGLHALRRGRAVRS